MKGPQNICVPSSVGFASAPISSKVTFDHGSLVLSLDTTVSLTFLLRAYGIKSKIFYFE